MGWSADFKGRLAGQRYRPSYLLEFITDKNTTFKPDHNYFGVDELGSQSPGSEFRIIPETVSIQGQSLSLQTWNVSNGGFTVQITQKVTSPAWYVYRGAWAQLKMKVNPSDDYEVIALGILMNISGQNDGVWNLQFQDALAGLYTINNTGRSGTVSNASLFSTVTATTTLTSDYPGGDATTLNVSSTSGFGRLSGGTGCVKVTDSANNVEYYVTFTGTTGTTFTGCTDDRFGTLRDGNTAAAGETVSEVGYVYGHPLDIYRYILVSSGDAVNGTYDVLPSFWGFGIPEYLVDIAQIGEVKSKTMTGADNFHMVTDQWVDNGLSWITPLLNPLGVPPTVRQGQIAVGYVEGLNAGEVKDSIKETDIVDVLSYTAWDPSSYSYKTFRYGVHATHAAQTLTYHGTSLTSAGHYSLPAINQYTADISAYSWTNDGTEIAEPLGRMGKWYFEVSEVVQVQVSGWHWAQWQVTNIVEMFTDRIVQRTSSPKHRRFMIIGIQPFRADGTTILTLATWNEQP